MAQKDSRLPRQWEIPTMTKKLATVHAKQVRGRMRIIGTGQTNTGQAYIKDMKELEVPDLADKRFKDQMKAAVDEMLAES